MEATRELINDSDRSHHRCRTNRSIVFTRWRQSASTHQCASNTWYLVPLACMQTQVCPLPRSVQPLVAGITVVTNTQTTPLRLGNRPQCVMRLTITYIHPFNGPFSGTTQVGRYQKGKTNLDFTEARDSEWQWHQLGHMQVASLHLAPDRLPRQHLTTQFFTGRMPFLPPNQQRQSTQG